MIVASTTTLGAGDAHGEFYDSIAAWQVAVGGPVTSVGFHEGVGSGWEGPINEFYADSHGLHMAANRLDSAWQIPLSSAPSNGDYYLITNGGGFYYAVLTLTLDAPVKAVAFEKSLRRSTIFAYSGDLLVASFVSIPGTSQGLAGYGLVFDQPVDRIRFEQDDYGDLAISALHWSVVPAPGALSLLAIVPLAARRRR